MIRHFAAAGLVSCFAAAGWAESTAPQSARTISYSAKPVARQFTPRTATETQRAATAALTRCEIGVIPIAGNLFTIERIGPFRFNNTYMRAGADGWGMDELVVSRVRAAAHGAAVQRILYSREDLMRGRDKRSLFRSINGELTDFVRRVAAGSNCDRYVLVHRDGAGKEAFGVGIIRYVSPVDSQVYLFALMHVRVYDGRTFELIKDGPAKIEDESLLARAYLNPVGGPYLKLDEQSFPASRAEAVANPILREGVRTLLTKSLDKTLPAMLTQSEKERSR